MRGREGGREGEPVTEKLMEPDNEFFFIIRNVASLDVWSEII